MTTIEMIKLAIRASDKGWDFEQLKYGDDLYGKEEFADDVWEFVEERKLIGSAAFDQKYPEAT